MPTNIKIDTSLSQKNRLADRQRSLSNGEHNSQQLVQQPVQMFNSNTVRSAKSSKRNANLLSKDAAVEKERPKVKASSKSKSKKRTVSQKKGISNICTNQLTKGNYQKASQMSFMSAKSKKILSQTNRNEHSNKKGYER